MTCSWCGADFAARAGARFCSSRCRVGSHRAAPPPELVALPRWVRHRAKRPITAWGSSASSTDPRTWSTFDRAAASSHGDGLGFVLAADGIACIDLDHCIVDGVLTSQAQAVVDACRGTYIEVSPSGTGLHIFGLAEVGRGRIGGWFEVYDRGRYMTVTGRRWRRAPLRLADISAAIAALDDAAVAA